MGFTIETGISAATVFLQGLLSFFSPCVLPLVPLYLGYLSGGVGAAETERKKAEGLRLFIRVLFFVLGISFAFFWALRRQERFLRIRECYSPGSEGSW